MGDRAVDGASFLSGVGTPTSSSAALAVQIREAIYARRPAAGTYLFGLGDLAQKSGYGPSVVREALQQLTAVGLIEVRRGSRGGVYARQVGPEVVASSLGALVLTNGVPREQVIEARREIEGISAKLAARHATSKDLETLSGSIERARAIGQDSAAFAEENVTFHLAVAAATHNDVIIALTRSVREVFFEETIAFEYQPDALRGAMHAHERLVDHIRSGDGAAAAELMASHVHEFNNYVERSGQISDPASTENSRGDSS